MKVCDRADRIVAEAERIASQEAQEAARGQRIADAISAAAARDAASPSLTPTAQQDLLEERRAAALARNTAASERRQADAAAEAARLIEQNPAAVIPAIIEPNNRLEQLRIEQERLAQQLDAEGDRQRPQCHRMR